jgi:hypothetical protein
MSKSPAGSDMYFIRGMLDLCPNFPQTLFSISLTNVLNPGFFFEVWHFDETEQYDPKTKTGGLFTDYVNTFLKMKQEASGWPEWCQR